ncbi:hypothetical protein G6F40_017026 [Rhizopus arrhizus]|nr:hypothetical protein G6F40_017026 [Rhizopus arrhizus]
MKADQPARGLQARDAVQRGGNPHRATRVRPQRGRREAGRDSHARSAGRAARRVGFIARVTGGASLIGGEFGGRGEAVRRWACRSAWAGRRCRTGL